jgi:hypothetical protein
MKHLLCSLAFLACSFFAIAATAQDFSTSQIAGTNYTSPRFQMRFNTTSLNPPFVFDLGSTLATQAFMTANSLAGFTTTFAITPPSANRSILWLDSGGTVALMPGIGGQITTNGTAIATGVCQAQPALTITGTTITSTADWSVPTALPATWQTGIHVMPVVTANTVTLSLCNATAGTITPAAQAVNIRVFN